MIGLVPAKLEPRRARIDRVAKPTRMAGLKPQSVRSGRSTSTAYSAVRRGWLQLQGVQMYLLYFSSTDRSTTGLDGNRNSSERPQVTGARAGLPCMDRGLRGTRGRDVLLLVRPPRPYSLLCGLCHIHCGGWSSPFSSFSSLIPHLEATILLDESDTSPALRTVPYSLLTIAPILCLDLCPVYAVIITNAPCAPLD